MEHSRGQGAWTWGPRGRGHPLAWAALFVVAGLMLNLLHGLLMLGILQRFGLDVPSFSPTTGFETDEPVWALLITAVTFLPIALGLVYVFQVRLSQVPWTALWLPSGTRKVRALAQGSAAALLLLAVLLLILLFSGAVESATRGELWEHGVAVLLITFILYGAGFGAQSAMEEIVFRGFLFRQLGHWQGGAVAIGGSAMVFALAHGLNPGSSALSLLNTVLSGLLLGLVRARHDLWSAIGLHAGWNLALSLCGVPVSGFALPSLVVVVLRSRPAWSGGPYGVEGSVGTTIVVGVAVLVMLLPGSGRALSRDWWWRRPAADPARPESPPGPRGTGPDPDPTT